MNSKKERIGFFGVVLNLLSNQRVGNLYGSATVVRVLTNHYLLPCFVSYCRGLSPHGPLLPWFLSSRTTKYCRVSCPTAVVCVLTDDYCRGSCPHEPLFTAVVPVLSNHYLLRWFVSSRTTTCCRGSCPTAVIRILTNHHLLPWFVPFRTTFYCRGLCPHERLSELSF